MNPCFRSMSCLLTVAAFALCSTEATARNDGRQQHAGKTHEAKKTPEAKEARSHRSAAVEKRRHAKHAESKSKRSNATPIVCKVA